MDPLNVLQLRERKREAGKESGDVQRGGRTGIETQRERGGRERRQGRGGNGRKGEREERFKEPPGYKTLCFVTSENIGTHITTPNFLHIHFGFLIYFTHLKILKHQKEGTFLKDFFDAPLLSRFPTHSSIFKQKP